MNNGLKRKEVWLPKSVLSFFETKAKEKKWSVKKFMEQALIDKYQSYKEEKKASKQSQEIKVPDWVKEHNKNV